MTEESIKQNRDWHFRLTGQEMPVRFMADLSIDQLFELVTIPQKQLIAELYLVLRQKTTWESSEGGIQKGLDSYLNQFLPMPN